jgi:hypothetical protein
MQEGVLQSHPGVIGMAEIHSKKPTAVAADMGRLREELERLFSNARPAEDRSVRAGGGLVIRGK